MVEAATLAELAEKIGIEPSRSCTQSRNSTLRCRTTFRSWRGELDGKGTTGITPKKSNWAMPLDAPPFRAYPVTGGVTFSFGGVQVDTRGAQVISTIDQPIEGLFASGD